MAMQALAGVRSEPLPRVWQGYYRARRRVRQAKIPAPGVPGDAATHDAGGQGVFRAGAGILTGPVSGLTLIAANAVSGFFVGDESA